MRAVTVTGLLAATVIVAALGYLVLEAATTGEDWVELGAICAAVLALSLGARRRATPRPSRTRTIRRTPESKW